MHRIGIILDLDDNLALHDGMQNEVIKRDESEILQRRHLSLTVDYHGHAKRRNQTTGSAHHQCPGDDRPERARQVQHHAAVMVLS